MSTHAQVGVKFSDNGQIIGTTVHYDGYPDHMMPALREYITMYTMTGLVTIIKEAQDAGGIRSFDARLEDIEMFEDSDFDDVRLDETNWNESWGNQHLYLIDYKTGDITHKG